MKVDIQVKMPDEFIDSLREVIERLDKLLEKCENPQVDESVLLHEQGGEVRSIGWK